MLSIGRIRPGGAEYYVGEIATSAEDYYLGHGEAPGRWVGSLADEMGLKGEVDPDHFRALLEGRHPFTGEVLVAGRRTKAPHVSEADGAEWLSAQEAAAQLGVSARFVRRLLAAGDLPGEKARSETTGRIAWRVQRADVNIYAGSHRPPKARPGFDLTLRPPKSVSVLWALGDHGQRAQIRQAHREAVDEVVRYYESQAVFARAKGARIMTAGLVAAAFDHRTSRAGDPLLHTHVVVANLTLTVADTWRALDGRPVYDHALSGGHMYQAHVRHLLTDRLGVEWGPVVNGCADVVGVPQAVIDEFSQRRDEIEELLAESGYTSGRARQAATLATRKAKDRTVDADTLARDWRDRAAELGFDHEAVEACFGRARAADRSTDHVDRLYEYLAGPHGLTEQASTFTRRDVVRGLACALREAASADDLGQLADRFLTSERVVVLAGPTSGRNSQVVVGLDGRKVRTGGMAVFSTPELLATEARVLRWSEEGFGTPGPTAAPEAIASALAERPGLTAEQVAMVRAVCGSSDAMQPVVGRPGSGKTYATEACVAALAVSGVPVAGCAVSATAAAELESSAGFAAHTGRSATTIASLLIDLDHPQWGGFPAGTVLFVDEASMVGTRDLACLADHLARVGGSMKLIGDPDQHASVDTGGVFRVLSARKGDEVVALVGNNRQLDADERRAVEEYRQGDIAGAISRYDAAGKVTRGESANETYDALVADWYQDRRNGTNDPMLAGTNAVRRALNARARMLLKADGLLAGPALVVSGREFMIGDEVVARRNDRRLRASGNSAFVKNGSVGTVLEVSTDDRDLVVRFAKEGTIRLASEYLAAGHVEHAYARTTYGVQGATLDFGRYQPSDASRFEEGYVAITRGREQTRIYVTEGDLEVEDEAGHNATQGDETGLGTVVAALARRSAKQLAHEVDADALMANELARLSMKELRRRQVEVEKILAERPPPAVRSLATERRNREALSHRRDAWAAGRSTLNPRRRRAAAQALTSLDRTSAGVDPHIAELEGRQAAHESFEVEHQADFAERDLIRAAQVARSLQRRIEIAIDPPEAVVEILGPRPTHNGNVCSGTTPSTRSSPISMRRAVRRPPTPAPSTSCSASAPPIFFSVSTTTGR
ncbi:MAG: MobF family relaxase [Acidimicrobiales bacterium]